MEENKKCQVSFVVNFSHPVGMGKIERNRIFGSNVMSEPSHEKKYVSNKNEHNWAASWQNQQNGCVPSEDSDQPGHPPRLIRGFAVHPMGS